MNNDQIPVVIPTSIKGADVNALMHSNPGRPIEFREQKDNKPDGNLILSDEYLSGFDINQFDENNTIENTKNDKNSPIVGLVNSIFKEAVRAKASDIHFEPKEGGVKIRLRVNGSLIDLMNINQNISKFINARIKVISKLNVSEKRKSQDGKVMILVDDKKLDLRVSFIPNAYGERCVVRVLMRESLKGILEKNSDSNEFKEILSLANKKHGLLLVCGPTGSGKSTTMYGIVDSMKEKNINILTIEDPIEYNIEGIGQTQVDEENGITFSDGLKAILRQDPDMIMIGEIRDLGTAKIAIQSSLTGHMVYSTLHSNTSVGAIYRLMDLGVDPYLISSSLTGVVSQRLVRILCDCATKSNLNLEIGGRNVREKKTNKGCDKCNYIGYKGRKAVYGVIRIDKKSAEAIHNKVSEVELNSIVGEDGMIDGVVDMVNKGLTDISELKMVMGEG